MTGPSAGLFLGLDLGTSGVRSAVVDGAGNVVSRVRTAYPGGRADDPDGWWSAAGDCLMAQTDALRADGGDPSAIRSMAVDGTSGSMVLTDAALVPVTPALMYDSGGFADEAVAIAAHAPDPSIARGTGSALARMLRLQSRDPDGRAAHLMHQADLVLARLRGRGGASDDNNVLKLGWDPAARAWPGWFAAAGVRTGLLPRVHRPGDAVGPVSGPVAGRLGLSHDCLVRAGTTDSIAAFLASGATEVGEAVTSLGTTMAVKLLSDRRVDDPARGLYSHRLGDRWLAGGASNTGGGALLTVFDAGRIAALSDRIDPSRPSPHDFYPLVRPGERFPVNDPALVPRMGPRPEDDVAYLHGLLEGIARIETQSYAALVALGAPAPNRILTAGGGARNAAWTAIRRRVVHPSVGPADEAEAAVGMARLCRTAEAAAG